MSSNTRALLLAAAICAAVAAAVVVAAEVWTPTSYSDATRPVHRSPESVSASPPASIAPSNPSRVAVRSHGETQLRAMLQDRPSLKSLVTPGDELWTWTVSHFDGVGTGFLIFWDAALPNSPFRAECHPPYGERRAAIRVRGLPEHRRKATTAAFEVSPTLQELYWTRVVFELLNLEGTPQFVKAHQDALAGRLSRDQYIEQYTRAEHQALLRRVAFYETVWVPFAAGNGMQLKPWLWRHNTPEKYEDWIDLYGDWDSQGEYPFVPFGEYFDEHYRGR